MVEHSFWKAENQAYLLILANAPGYGIAFQIRIRIQDNQINADPDPQHEAVFRTWIFH